MAHSAEFRIHLAPLPAGSHDNGVAYIWASAGGISFPGIDWNDFALDVVTLWAVELLKPWAGRKSFQFLSIDELFFLEKAGGQVSIHFLDLGSSQAAEHIVPGVSEEQVVHEVLQALKMVLNSQVMRSYSADVTERCIALRSTLELHVQRLSTR